MPTPNPWSVEAALKRLRCTRADIDRYCSSPVARTYVERVLLEEGFVRSLATKQLRNRSGLPVASSPDEFARRVASQAQEYAAQRGGLPNYRTTALDADGRPLWPS